MACCLIASSHYPNQCSLIIPIYCQPHWMGHGLHLNLKWIWIRCMTSVRTCGINLTTVSLEILMISILDINLEITNSRLQPHVPGASELICVIIQKSSLVLPVKLLSCECHRTSFVSCQHWFKYWLGAVRQHAITWANVVDPYLCRHMASLDHNELICLDCCILYWYNFDAPLWLTHNKDSVWMV